jgi:hypothetical protein
MLTASCSARAGYGAARSNGFAFGMARPSNLVAIADCLCVALPITVMKSYCSRCPSQGTLVVLSLVPGAYPSGKGRLLPSSKSRLFGISVARHELERRFPRPCGQRVLALGVSPDGLPGGSLGGSFDPRSTACPWLTLPFAQSPVSQLGGRCRSSRCS